MSEGVAISIGRFTWDSSNCRGNVSLIPHQLHLLISNGCIVIIILVDYTTLGSDAR